MTAVRSPGESYSGVILRLASQRFRREGGPGAIGP
jgi:hypothetical protein